MQWIYQRKRLKPGHRAVVKIERVCWDMWEGYRGIWKCTEKCIVLAFSYLIGIPSETLYRSICPLLSSWSCVWRLKVWQNHTKLGYELLYSLITLPSQAICICNAPRIIGAWIYIIQSRRQKQRFHEMAVTVCNLPSTARIMGMPSHSISYYYISIKSTHPSHEQWKSA